MNRNVEIKARVTDTENLLRRVKAIADSGPEILNQEDVFFRCAKGRLKLRSENGQSSQLIYYDRADDTKPKASSYMRTPVPDPAAMRQVLELAWGIIGIIRKRRTLFLVGPTRIHLDEVEGLGSFVELEVVLSPRGSVEEGTQIARELMKKLGIDKGALLAGAYFDLQTKTEQ